MALFLPLHVWDRELDSRIYLAVLASSKGITSAIGHEYNLAQIYKYYNSSSLFRHGRPRDNYRIEWNNDIIKNGGIASIVDEEGGNDLEFNIKSLKNSFLPGVNQKSLSLCSSIYTWNTLENEIVLKTGSGLDKEINKKLKLRMNSRLELLLPQARSYFDRRTNAIREFFGDYILISDNFGKNGFGGTKKDPRQFLGNDTSKEAIKERMDQHNTIQEQSKQFTKIIQKIIENNPDIQFIFRPHPISSNIEWGKALGEHRNLYIIYKDTIEPWINNSKLLIHAGCTTGLQAKFLNADIIDISNFIRKEEGQIAISTTLSHQVSTIEELDYEIKKAYDKSRLSLPKKESIKARAVEEYEYQYNQYVKDDSSQLNKINQKIKERLRIGNKSSILSIIQENETAHNEGISKNPVEEANTIVKDLGQATNRMLPLGKISYINDKEVRNRIIDAANAIGCEVPQSAFIKNKRTIIIAGRKLN